MDEELLHKRKSIPPKLLYHSPACVKDVNSKKNPEVDGYESPQVWLQDRVNVHKGTENEAENESWKSASLLEAKPNVSEQ